MYIWLRRVDLLLAGRTGGGAELTCDELMLEVEVTLGTDVL